MVVRTAVPTIRSRKPGANRSIWADDRRRRVAGKAVGDMSVAPHRVNIADRSLWVGQILLSDENERSLRHPSGVDISLGGGQFPIVTDQVHGAGPTRVGVRPGHAALDGEVDLERTWATPELGKAREIGVEDGRRGSRRPRLAPGRTS